MTKIIVSGTIDLPPENVAPALEAGRPLIEGALAAHFECDWYLNMRDNIGSFGITGSDVAKYRVDLAEPVYDETMTPRADFFTAKD